MAQGYIVARKDADGDVDAYWDGTQFVLITDDADAIDSSDFVETVENARFIQGSIQAANTDFDVVKLEAESNITLIP
ncbi:hypothetical protein [Halotia branconii]|uniref:Uncharacterized protein n=1 Tax=Halotia branconii CENA392 TaxID=1539056 RepID=A0AAJ6NNI5_9CYAN|nr:hypothetical protein [Halotia branconii]WGV23702.1 hypothetical protein QI031_18015 [Halotia branconii CENA392]